MPTLVIANKCYSSWSLRPWLLLTELGIRFDEVLIPLEQPDTQERIRAYSPAGKVPILIDGEIAVWESLAIMDYVAETWPEAGVWPEEREPRALARSISAEMHAGFTPLRNVLSMNLGKRFASRDRGPEVAANIARIEAMWRGARGRFGQGGPFLFGTFSAADAMYAPVVTRLDTYGVAVAPDTRAYMDAVLSLASFGQWRDAALRETWVVGKDEANEEPVANLRAVG